MHTIHGRNVNDIFETAANILWAAAPATQQDSRAGPVTVHPGPVTTLYEEPRERVLFHPARDANPFFHLVEALWMLCGNDELKYLTPYVKRMSEFSDDGGRTMPGAYGHRWRYHFPRDQVEWAIQRLWANPGDRRVVIQMYDAGVDMEAADKGGADVPCNLVALPWVDRKEARVNLTVFCRSNDMVWGALGANAVHFSVLLEYIAAGLGLPVGRYWQISNNYHAYIPVLEKIIRHEEWGPHPCPYKAGEVCPMPMFREMVDESARARYGTDLNLFFTVGPDCVGIEDKFLRRAALPMVMAHRVYKEEGVPAGLEVLQQCRATDWALAAREWLERRRK